MRQAQISEHSACPVCDSVRLHHHGQIAPAHRVGFDKHEIIECADCGLSFSHPLPSPEELRAFYESEEAYVGCYDHDHEWQRYQHQQDLKRILKARRGNPGRLLDVGCSYGLLLEVASGAGWDCYGVEPNECAAKVAASRIGVHRVTIGMVDALPESWTGFDVVSLSHVWEHFTDFRQVLRALVSRLRPGGIVAIQAPNRRCWHTARRGPDFRPVEHPYYWTYRSVFLELARCGLRPQVAPPLWENLYSGTASQKLKELALFFEARIGARVNWGVKSTLEVHGTLPRT